MHPDKARQSFVAKYTKKHAKKPNKRETDTFVKEASARFARLGVIANVLRGPNRERYDFFLDHGFPKWRGTGYYYQRYRPGAGSVLVGLFIMMGGVAHYGALVLSWQRQRQFVERYIHDARKLAWGNNMVVPGLDTAAPPTAPAPNGDTANTAYNRRQKRLQEKENKKNAKKGITAEEISEPQEAKLISGPQRSKRRVVAENGKVLIVDSVGNVFLEEVTEEGETHELLLDVRSPRRVPIVFANACQINEIPKPTMYDTVLFRLPIFLWNKTGGQFIGKAQPPSLDATELNNDDIHEPALASATAPNANGDAKRRSKAKVRQRP